jgi:hypothetical protein
MENDDINSVEKLRESDVDDETWARVGKKCARGGRKMRDSVKRGIHLLCHYVQ